MSSRQATRGLSTYHVVISVSHLAVIVEVPGIVVFDCVTTHLEDSMSQGDESNGSRSALGIRDI